VVFDENTPLVEGDLLDVEAAPLEGDGLSEEILGSETVWHGSFLHVDDVTLRLPNGHIAHHDVVRHPGAVAVIALTDEGKLVLVHQYRTSLEQVTVEIPAGKLELGEDPAAAAARELAEETGYTAARMAYLGPIAVAAGYSDELIHFYMAMGLSFVGASPDDDEFVQVDLVDLGEMVDRVLDGKVIDSKTVIGVLLCDAISRRMVA
jgi:ADP-ribose pyrophosphatase